ncbi:MAG TPA: peptidoglycan editing factor PgeF [Chloroflexota bacterium]|nr:peptidoglycan editing factor PgeF [Chloroflexota bacterium]
MKRQQSDNGIVYFQFESLAGNGREAHDGRIQHAIFSRQGGVSPAPFHSLNLSVSVKDDPAHVFANRRRAYGLFGRDNDTAVHAHLVHGNTVTCVTGANNGDYTPHSDGLITNEPGCALTMNFADCTPILLYDPVNHAIGLGHAGWKGAVVDLPGAMVRAMQRAFGTNPADVWAGIGPCIGWAQYEVDEPLVGEVQTAFRDWTQLLRRPDGRGNGRYHFDLPAANQQRLQEAGVRPIELSGLCTAERTDLFFSHRAEKGKTGRFGAIFVLQPV